MASELDTYKGGEIIEGEIAEDPEKMEVSEVATVDPDPEPLAVIDEADTFAKPLDMTDRELAPTQDDSPPLDTSDADVGLVLDDSDLDPDELEKPLKDKKLAAFVHDGEVVEDPKPEPEPDLYQASIDDGLNLDDSDLDDDFNQALAIPVCERCDETLTNPSNRHWYDGQVYGKDCAEQVKAGAPPTDYQLRSQARRRQAVYAQEQPQPQPEMESRQLAVQPRTAMVPDRTADPIQQRMDRGNEASQALANRVSQSLQGSNPGGSSACQCSCCSGKSSMGICLNIYIKDVYINDNHGTINIGSLLK